MTHADFVPFLLSPFDHVFPPGLYAATVLYFQAEAPSSLNDQVEQLRCGLNRLIKIVPFLSGVVAVAHHPEKTNVMEVRPCTTTTTIPSFSSSALVQVKDYPEFGLPGPTRTDGGLARGEEATRHLMPDFETLTQITTTGPAPVFRAQINRLADGIALCLAVNHMVLDGKGNDMLFTLLAWCCRDPVGATWSTTAAAAQVEARQYLHTLGSRLGAAMMPGGNVGEEASYERGEGLAPDSTSAVYSLVFSEERIQLLKRQCNARLPDLLRRWREQQQQRQRDPAFLSSNDLLTALLWICVSQVVVAQQQLPSSTLGVAVNSRRRFPQPLPDEYLGNSVAYADCMLPMSELGCLQDKPKQTLLCQEGSGTPVSIDEDQDEDTLQLLTRIAYRIRCSIADLDGPALGQLVAGYFQTPDWSQILLQRCDVIVSSLNDWQVSSWDFGPRLGPVQRVEFLPPSSPAGECIIKPTMETEAAVREVMVTLQPEQMRRMSQFPLLQWALVSQSPTVFYRSDI